MTYQNSNKDNSNAIVAALGKTTTNYAASLARAYRGGGYTDWYLPSKDELNKLFLNKPSVDLTDIYWSSSQYINWVSLLNWQELTNGAQSITYNRDAQFVHAIRPF